VESVPPHLKKVKKKKYTFNYLSSALRRHSFQANFLSDKVAKLLTECVIVILKRISGE
jgi:hypothetical protein